MGQEYYAYLDGVCADYATWADDTTGEVCVVLVDVTGKPLRDEYDRVRTQILHGKITFVSRSEHEKR